MCGSVLEPAPAELADKIPKRSPVKDSRPQQVTMQDIIAKSINAADCVKKNAFVENYDEAKALVETIVNKLPPSTTHYSPSLHGVQEALAAVDSLLL
jgi:hypothetical protein